MGEAMTVSRQTSRAEQSFSLVAAAAFILITAAAGYRAIGLPPVVIVGGSGVAGFVMWYRTYLKGPLAPEVILPPFLLTVAALEVRMAEEYFTKFGPYDESPLRHQLERAVFPPRLLLRAGDGHRSEQGGA